MEGPILITEAAIALKKWLIASHLGQMGSQLNFSNSSGKYLGYFLVKALNYSYNEGELSITQKEGIITCIPKGNKDKQLLKNWRPISLLNVTYKIASAAIANRIKSQCTTNYYQ